ncbi:MAG: class I SAM-dependent methyltransferase [Myxococcales bacterium]|nr:class I SAM-dependent methyltransferase [Myxococcales bacterium]
MSSYGQDFWNERYDSEDYLFGVEPAAFLRAQAHHITPHSRVLVPADGEGRNSVYLASLGHDVVATDFAPNALAKARDLASKAGVRIDFRQVDLFSWTWPESEFDAIAAVFVQFAPPTERARMFEGMKLALRPGGVLLLHGYTPKQLEYGTGGPKDVAHLYTDELLAAAFEGWDVSRLVSYEAELSEGSGHSGRSAVVDLIARKPA